MKKLCRCAVRCVVPLLLVASLSGCSLFRGEALPFRDPTLDLVWPPQPNPPRIRFLREIAGPDTVIPEQGKVGRLLSMVTGEHRAYLPLVAPYGIVSDGREVVYVADSAAGVVHRYDLANREISYIYRAGGEDLASPVGVALDKDGNLYVSDSVNAKVYVFSATGRYLRSLGDGTVKFLRPAGIAIDGQGDIYVVDVLAHKLYVFAGDGHFQRDFPRAGSAEPLNFPTNVAVDRAGNVYVTDSMNFTVKVYDHDGNFKRKIGEVGDSTGSFARPKGVAVDSDCHVYVVDSTHANFQIFDQAGKLLLFVGANGKGPGEFDLPSGIFIDSNDRIFIADSHNHRLQIFQYLKVGKP
ncbi:6-bladed beta-propeller [Geotalea uraniireducens]|nr:6-bladed beta-propeller [Geotalea uraniireducens]